MIPNFDFYDKISIDKLKVIKNFISKALDKAERMNLEPKNLMNFEK